MLTRLVYNLYIFEFASLSKFDNGTYNTQGLPDLQAFKSQYRLMSVKPKTSQILADLIK